MKTRSTILALAPILALAACAPSRGDDRATLMTTLGNVAANSPDAGTRLVAVAAMAKLDPDNFGAALRQTQQEIRSQLMPSVRECIVSRISRIPTRRQTGGGEQNRREEARETVAILDCPHQQGSPQEGSRRESSPPERPQLGYGS